MGFLSGLGNIIAGIGGAVAAGAAGRGSSQGGFVAPNYNGMINQMAAQQLAARQAEINRAKDEAINNYTQQIGKADSMYQPIRNQAAVTGAKNAQLLKEQMASQGLFNSGDNVSAQLQNRNQTATAVNQSNLQQQDYVNKLQNAIEQVRQNANYESAAAVAQTEAQKMQSLLNQANQDRQYNYQLNRDKIGDERYKQQFDYQKSRDTANDQWRNKTFDYQSARDKLNDLFREKDWNRQGIWHDADMQFREKDWNRQGQWHQDDVNYRNQQLALSKARASSTSSSGYGTNAQNSRANALWNNVNGIIKSNGTDGLIEARQYLMDNKSDISSAVGKKNFELVQDAVGKALVKQNQKEFNLMKRAQAFGYTR